ncbi:MAG: carbohydrate ABC transporter permease [Elusimicrobia bacterium]|nr:carbohydrate ABC transporter permease [Elusimicrobiota bacterium]
MARFKFLIVAAAALAAAWSLAPFLWQAASSVKSTAEIFRTPITYWPRHWTLTNYGDLFFVRPFARYIANSLLIAGASSILSCAAAALAAYALTRLGLAKAVLLARLVLLAALLPPTLLVIPLYKVIQSMGLINHPLGLILCYATLNLPLALWLLTHAFRQFPLEIEEAAKLDGFGSWAIFWRFILPLSLPAVVTSAILVFIFSWNEFLLALVLMTQDARRTAPVGIAMLSGVSSYEIPWNQIAAAVVATTLPIVALVLAFERRIVEGLTAGAVKG